MIVRSAEISIVRAYVERHAGFPQVMMNVFLLSVVEIFTLYERQSLQRRRTVPPFNRKILRTCYLSVLE